MLTDIEIAQSTKMKPISDIALSIGINEFEPYGKYKAKIRYDDFGPKKGKLVLVTAMSPTPLGEGKTTMSIGLADGLRRIGENAVLALREPSLGPVFGIKGGAAGGGYSQVVPMEDINLHFTGDIHAIESANNLLAALIDNHIFQGNDLDIQNVTWRRCMDMNDRQLRKIESGLGGKFNGVPREDGFDITVASEVMAIFCLATNLDDLQTRLGNIIIGYNSNNDPVRAKDLHAEGAMTALLKDAFNPNLVQTLEGTPAFIHGGPFANIAHGCNSVVATKLAMSYGDWVVTEAGFGADLGAEKFLDIKCRQARLQPDAIAIVATIKALKYNGGVPKDKVREPNNEALVDGIANLRRHVYNMKSYNIPVIVVINRFNTDTDAEIELVRDNLPHVKIVTCTSFADGSKGSIEFAKAVRAACEDRTPQLSLETIHCAQRYPYDIEESLTEKMHHLAARIYGAKEVTFSAKAVEMIQKIEEMGYDDLPICVAKTQYSFTDQPTDLGAPDDFTMTVNEVRLSAGAGFVVMICGKMMTMPGLPKVPAANNISVDENHQITGLF